MNRVELIRKELEKLGAYALLLSDVAEVSWATGFTGDDSHCLITKNDAFFFTDFRYTEQANKQVKEFEIIETGYADRLLKMAKTAPDVLAIDFDRTSVSEEKRISQAFCGAKIVDASENIDKLRRIKNKREIDGMKKGAVVTENAFSHIIKYIKPGVTENDIYAELVYFMNKAGADPSFTPIIASGENGSMPHATVTDRKVKNGDFVTMDFGVKMYGVCTDFTRTIAVGGIEKEKEIVYNTVKNAQNAALCSLKPGISGKEADGVARDLIYNAGYKGRFGHGTGHGVGVEIHESPRLSLASEDILLPGMIVTVEPGIYIPGKFGVRIEDMVRITEDGYENFYTAQKELIIV